MAEPTSHAGLVHGPGPLTTVLFSDETLDAVLQMIVAAALAGVQGAYGASISLRDSDVTITSQAAPDDVRALDDLQYAAGSGPCLAAIATGETVLVHLSAEQARWPHLSAFAMKHGIDEVFSLPLIVRGVPIAALNLYAHAASPFGEPSFETGRALAAQAAIALANAVAFLSSQVLNDRLQAALTSREIIGQAQGILMARQKCTREQAFRVLQVASQRSNQKLRDVAATLVGGVEESAGQVDGLSREPLAPNQSRK